MLAYDRSRGAHHVLYEDGEDEWLKLPAEVVSWQRGAPGGTLGAGLSVGAFPIGLSGMQAFRTECALKALLKCTWTVAGMTIRCHLLLAGVKGAPISSYGQDSYPESSCISCHPALELDAFARHSRGPLAAAWPTRETDVTQARTCQRGRRRWVGA